MRSRLWSLILRELPSPFRQVGLELAHVLRWLDHGAAKIWLGLYNSPCWYVVTMAGGLTLLLTTLLFFPYIASHDPTLSELAIDGKAAARVTRASLEASGDWSAQDRWRVAHLFVEHRPPRRRPSVRLDSRLEEAAVVLASRPALRSDRRRTTDRRDVAGRSRVRDAEPLPASHALHRVAAGKPILGRLDPEVRLELKLPGRAAQTPRLVYDQLVRNPGADFDPAPAASRYRQRNNRLLVQAEWNFDRDCNNVDEPPRHSLSRRVIPVPEPQWEEPRSVPVPRSERRPDLAFELELLREHLPNVGEFPPRSRSISVAAHSEFAPAMDRPRRSNRQVAQDAHWNRSSSHVEHLPPPEAYISRTDHHVSGTDSAPLSEIDDDNHNLPSFAEVALRIELAAPHEAIAGRQHQSSLKIHNEGPSPVSLVRVRESLAELQTVTDANPPARIHHDMLERDLISLTPGRERRLAVTWLPSEEGSRIHRAAVTMHAAVGVTTHVVAPEPEPAEKLEPDLPVRQPAPLPRVEPMSQIEVAPLREEKSAVSCEVKHRNRVAVDEMVELEIIVRNSGETPLSGVRILVEVPDELKHRQGSEVEYEIGSLARGATHRAVMKLLTTTAGQAVSRIHVTSHESAESKARATITIVAKPKSQPVSPVPSAARPAPATKPRPIPTADGCCCPEQPVACIWNPWNHP